MAVENKFRLNVIAASVLMGLSLSAVAAESVQPTDGKVAAPAKVTSGTGFNPVAVAQSSEPADPTTLNYKGESTVSSLFDSGGAVGAYESALSHAFGKEGVLDDKALTTISEYNNAVRTDGQTEADWTLFKTKAGFINKEYNDALTGLYGTGKHAYTENLSTTKLTTLVSGDSGAGTFGAYVKGVSDFKSALNSFQTALIGAGNTGVENGVTTATLSGSNDLKDAANKVVAYRAYLQAWAEGQEAALKREDATARIMATLPQLCQRQDF